MYLKSKTIKSLAIKGSVICAYSSCNSGCYNTCGGCSGGCTSCTGCTGTCNNTCSGLGRIEIQ